MRKLSFLNPVRSQAFPYVEFCDCLQHNGVKGFHMPQSVKLSDALIKQARLYGEVYHRSTAKQIEYWKNWENLRRDP